MQSYTLDTLGDYAILCNEDGVVALARLERPTPEAMLLTVVSTHASYMEALDAATVAAAQATEPEPPALEAADN